MLPQKLTFQPYPMYTHSHLHTCLGFARRAAGVQNEEGILGITPLGLKLITCFLHEFVPPQVNPLVPGDLQGGDSSGQEKTVNSSRWFGGGETPPADI